MANLMLIILDFICTSSQQIYFIKSDSFVFHNAQHILEREALNATDIKIVFISAEWNFLWWSAFINYTS